MSDLYIGLMSGTSADGVDAVLVDFDHPKPRLIATHYTPYSRELRSQILDLCHPGENEIHRLGELDIALAETFATSVQNLLQNSQTKPENIKAIGSHGQTIRHVPHDLHRFTMQIGDPNTLAAKTGITTVADFRRKDMALGGQGAPLVPAFHRSLFASNEVDRAIINIGGIANVTLLPKNSSIPVIGFDTGPGNALMDFWIHTHQNETYDQHGAWGARGTVNPHLLANMLASPYFTMPAPKSTGREYFNHRWLQEHIAKLPDKVLPVDVQATLIELTAVSIMQAVKEYLREGEIYICGGGAHNRQLLNRLQILGTLAFKVQTTESLGVHPDWVEAVAFAWLAQQTMQKRTGNLPSVTGAKHAAVLGGIYFA